VSFIRIAGIVLGLVAAVLIGFLVIGFLLPSEWNVERTTLIPALPEEIFPHVESAEGWTQWTPSPDTGIEFFGPTVGQGSGRRWDDPGYGQGEFVIRQIDRPRSVTYEVEVEGGAIRIYGKLELQRLREGTRVVWNERGDFGWNPLLGYLAGRMDELQGNQLEAALASLRRLVLEPEEEGETPSQSGSLEEIPT